MGKVGCWDSGSRLLGWRSMLYSIKFNAAILEAVERMFYRSSWLREEI
jgi:hypothetical protein